METVSTRKVIAMIPARYGSTRLPGKMLEQIHGKPLIQHTYENAAKCKQLSALVVLTDDAKIFDVVTGFGAAAMMTSPDCLTGTDRIIEALNTYPHLADSELILNIQGDEPCLEPAVMEQVIDALESDSACVMSTAVFPLDSQEEAMRPHRVKCVINHHKHAIYFSRGLIPHGLNGYCKDTTYYGHIGIYCYRTHFLLQYGALSPTPLQLAENLEQLKAIEHGFKIKVAVVGSESIGVDTPEDITKVEKKLWQKNTYLLQEECAPL